jgi:hypothetical protein
MGMLVRLSATIVSLLRDTLETIGAKAFIIDLATEPIR